MKGHIDLLSDTLRNFACFITTQKKFKEIRLTSESNLAECVGVIQTIGYWLRMLPGTGLQGNN